jgi:hypothetical protein
VLKSRVGKAPAGLGQETLDYIGEVKLGRVYFITNYKDYSNV